MNLPPFVYNKRFWEGVSFILAGVLLLLSLFGVIPDAYALSAGAILAGILAFLRFFGIDPSLRG
jgi:hypothetical protein